MRKFLLPATLMLVGLLTTVGCAKKQVVAVVPPTVTVVAPPAPPPAPEPVVAEPTPEPESLTVTGDGFELTLPEAGWVRRSPPSMTNVAYLVNADKMNRIIVSSKETTENLAALALEEVRGAKGSNFKLVSQKSIKSNGTNFTLLSLQNTNNVNIKVWSWITVKSGSVYVFRCGGVNSTENDQSAICTGVIKTLKLN